MLAKNQDVMPKLRMLAKNNLIASKPDSLIASQPSTKEGRPAGRPPSVESFVDGYEAIRLSGFGAIKLFLANILSLSIISGFFGQHPEPSHKSALYW